MKILRLLIFIILLLFPFGQLTRIPLAIAGISLYWQDLVVSLLVFWWSIYHFLKRKPFPKPPLGLPILGFILTALLSLSVNLSRLNSSELVISFFYLLRWSIYAGIYFVVYEITKNLPAGRQAKKQKTDNKILQFLAIIGVLVAIFGLIQYFLYPNLRYLYYLDWDPHQYRVFGTFLDPGFIGIILVLTLILLLSFKSLGKRLRIGGGLLVFLALLLTYSRSSYLALIVAIMVLSWLRKSAKFLAIPLLLLVFTLMITILPRPVGEGVKLERTSTISARVENYQQSLEIIKDNSLFGVGFNSLRFVKKDYGFLDKNWQENHSGAGMDSSLLFVMATTGVVGLVVYLWMWLRILKIKNQKSKTPACRQARHIKNKKYKKIPRNFYQCTLSSTAALFIHSFFLNSLFYPWVMIWMWMLLGISHSESK